MRDESNDVVGGLLAATFWQWLHIDILWIDERYRNQGYGRKLLSVTERTAIERRCKFVYLDTFQFQAPHFYLKQGCEVFGELKDFPRGFNRYFLKKEL